MFVCVCRAVTDGDIDRAVQQGCCSMRDLRNELGVATQCGRCASTAKDVLSESLGRVARETPAAA
ncbi:MAG: bacterioferritin-associated ferredoxin [Moraxellaceae bacterium]|jgi:bacterioferritin-associated ferredoxin|nr:bacterioferritin-associated ferredoxin [Moraxellaceae bacterium]MBP8852512.1 bacterioferritin-associated ferredoxin [Moraxellaceae bacterium]MBP9045382.1 bacterioferritin-associated ferredoxin [Moraxellaceae bacterium]MBP9731352.1 bacterioferritin-associated ferredoxin [Moraxellaceae bacterium]